MVMSFWNQLGIWRLTTSKIKVFLPVLSLSARHLLNRKQVTSKSFRGSGSSRSRSPGEQHGVSGTLTCLRESLHPAISRCVGVSGCDITARSGHIQHFSSRKRHFLGQGRTGGRWAARRFTTPRHSPFLR